MAAGQGSGVAEIERLRNSAWEAIGSATVGKATTERYWGAWQKHCRLYRVSSDGAPPTNATEMLLTFAVAVREGQHGNGNQIKVQSVSKALCAVAQKYVLDGHRDPRRASPAQHALDLPIARLLKKYEDEDPPPQPKLAVPMSMIETLIRKYTFSEHHCTVADLCIIAFFYLLRVGEYTSTTSHTQKRTIALRKCDVRLWSKGRIISPKESLETLLRADAATICIANTKNGTKGAVVHHEAIGGPVCPVAALAQRIHNLHTASAACPLSTVFHTDKQPTTVSDRDITIAVRWGATFDGLLDRGYTLERVSSHSLRAGGAMALALAGESAVTIMRVGRWTSTTYMTYIHSQIGALAKGLAGKMSRHHTFHNIG